MKKYPTEVPEVLTLAKDLDFITKYSTVAKSYPLHRHDFCEILYIVNGDVIYSVGERDYYVTPGSLLVLAPNVLHKATFGKRSTAFDRYAFHISTDYIRRISSPNTNMFLCFDTANPMHCSIFRLNIEKRKEIHDLFQRIHTINNRSKACYGTDALVHSLMTQLLVEINLIALDYSHSHEEKGSASALVQSAVSYIEQHYSQKITLEQLAEDIHISKDHLSHEFTRYYGCPPYQYILTVRLRHAEQLLIRGVTPTDVSRICGFQSYPNFYRQFKARYSISPKQYIKSINAMESKSFV